MKRMVKSRPARLGHWIQVYACEWQCSECSKLSNWTFPFCPNCGVRMMGGKEMNYIHTSGGHCYYELDKPVEEGGTYLVYNLYVHEEYRGKGYAKRMLQYVIDEIRGTGYTGKIYVKAESYLTSISNRDLAKFYTRMGLTVTNVDLNEEDST